jgi:hypothetical protein
LTPDGGEPDPDELLRRLREAAGPAPLPPLRLGEATPSDRPGAAGQAIGGARRAMLRLLTPALGELVAQLERDRHRQRAELEELRARVAALERDAQP